MDWAEIISNDRKVTKKWLENDMDCSCLDVTVIKDNSESDLFLMIHYLNGGWEREREDSDTVEIAFEQFEIIYSKLNNAFSNVLLNAAVRIKRVTSR